MPAPDSAKRLIEKFGSHLEAYKSGAYQEAQVRQEFIDPLFHILGWDMENTQGYAEAYKEVVHEDSVRIAGGAMKAPDYSFRVGGARKFFLEAKKPSVYIKGDPAPAFQVRRYAWSAKLPLSILTDFEEFAVYDCAVKPDKDDASSTARVMYLTFDEYESKWEEIAGTFSRQAVLQGSFDKYAASHKKKRGTTLVDNAFLAEIEDWRMILAKNIALRNPSLSQRDLNQAVQVTIDRIIFLRICEDRGIETYGSLQSLLNGENIYSRLKNIFQSADDRYNSGLFHFRREKDRPAPPDELTLTLALDDKPLKDIFRRLYYPDSPYEFSVISADILGQVYERFLGKVIRLTAGHQAKVEEKPEVKKAGGVYYTPTYIVDYIVKNTVGKLLEGKSPKEAAELKFLDPACGSGSFLIGAYQYLLDWHLEYYRKAGPDKHRKEVYQAGKNEWRLATAEKKRILLNNIYGVDIDSQAVEVTKLSLLLKVLEGENGETLDRNLKMLHERALPDLESNIKCGNSLIGPDFYEGKQMSLLDEEEKYRVNVFDWRREFEEVFAKGGFDAVIGNPPYVRIQNLKEWAPLEVEFYKEKYAAASKGNYDIYVVFIEKGFALLNSQGRLGLIVPNKFVSTDYGHSIRQLLTAERCLDKIIDFGPELVFGKVSIYTCLLFLFKGNIKNLEFVKVKVDDLAGSADPDRLIIPHASLDAEPWFFQGNIIKAIIERINVNSLALSNVPAKISRGSSSGADPIYCLKRKGNCYYTKEGDVVDVENEILRKPIYATDYNRYKFQPHNDEFIIFPYIVSDAGYRLMNEAFLKSEYPKAYKYLFSNKNLLTKRKQFREWFSFSAPRNLDLHDRSHLLVPLLADRGLLTRTPQSAREYCLMASGGFSISFDQRSEINPDYYLGIMNSKMVFWNLQMISNIFRGGWITCTKQYIETLPIKTIDLQRPSDKKKHDRMVELVEAMLELNKKLAGAKTAHDKEVLQRQIDATDGQIDRLVYDLYGLTEEEIKIVEESTR